eukprot:TRINITY_DN13759_c0_g1_i1.p1 TRINITY_DN13759_c0_g1~~TRINITY_DN13759_c0_g1_i1.p1  ORF type:complete len:215 (+),score=41.84 TRINITY_DN13759_c0_g1_i1:52-645(+)
MLHAIKVAYSKELKDIESSILIMGRSFDSVLGDFPYVGLAMHAMHNVSLFDATPPAIAARTFSSVPSSHMNTVFDMLAHPLSSTELSSHAPVNAPLQQVPEAFLRPFVAMAECHIASRVTSSWSRFTNAAWRTMPKERFRPCPARPAVSETTSSLVSSLDVLLALSQVHEASALPLCKLYMGRWEAMYATVLFQVFN